jgi:hypothetical protein
MRPANRFVRRLTGWFDSKNALSVSRIQNSAGIAGLLAKGFTWCKGKRKRRTPLYVLPAGVCTGNLVEITVCSLAKKLATPAALGFFKNPRGACEASLGIHCALRKLPGAFDVRHEIKLR